MKYIPASEVERLAQRWDMSDDEGTHYYNTCAEELRDLLASAVELPESEGSGYDVLGLLEVAFAENTPVSLDPSDCKEILDLIRPAPDNKLREVRSRDDRRGFCPVPEDAIANYELLEGEDSNYGDSEEQADYE